jgi:hypothetical protein
MTNTEADQPVSPEDVPPGFPLRDVAIGIPLLAHMICDEPKYFYLPASFLDLEDRDRTVTANG